MNRALRIHCSIYNTRIIQDGGKILTDKTIFCDNFLNLLLLYNVDPVDNNNMMTFFSLRRYATNLVFYAFLTSGSGLILYKQVFASKLALNLFA